VEYQSLVSGIFDRFLNPEIFPEIVEIDQILKTDRLLSVERQLDENRIFRNILGERGLRGSVNIAAAFLIQDIDKSYWPRLAFEKDAVERDIFDISDLRLAEFRDWSIAVDNETFRTRSIGLIGHRELVLGDTYREMAVVERFAVIKPHDFVPFGFLGRRASDTVSQENRARFVSDTIGVGFVGEKH